MARDHVVSTYLPFAVKHALTRLSAKEGCTQAELVRRLIIDELLDQGLLTKDQLIEDLISKV